MKFSRFRGFGLLHLGGNGFGVGIPLAEDAGGGGVGRFERPGWAREAERLLVDGQIVGEAHGGDRDAPDVGGAVFRWTGFAPWEIEFLFQGSLTSTFWPGIYGIGVRVREREREREKRFRTLGNPRPPIHQAVLGGEVDSPAVRGETVAGYMV